MGAENGVSPEYVSLAHAAKITGYSYAHVRRAAESGALPASNRGKRRRIAVKDLHEWMEKNKGGSKIPPKSKLKELIERHLPGLAGR